MFRSFDGRDLDAIEQRVADAVRHWPANPAWDRASDAEPVYVLVGTKTKLVAIAAALQDMDRVVPVRSEAAA